MKPSACLVLLVALAACSESPTEPKTGGAADDPAWSATPLGDPQAVAKVRESAEANAVLVVEGQIAEMAQGVAIFGLVDLALKSCKDNECSSCPTPWDFCCYTPEEIAAHTISVERRDFVGKPIRESLEGWHGLQKLDRVRIEGKVERDDHGNVTLVLQRASRL